MSPEIHRIETKLDHVIKILENRNQNRTKKKYLTAREVEDLIGIDRRTVLNRSNFDRSHHLYIPSVRVKNSKRKFFERVVIERLFNLG